MVERSRPTFELFHGLYVADVSAGQSRGGQLSPFRSTAAAVYAKGAAKYRPRIPLSADCGRARSLSVRQDPTEDAYSLVAMSGEPLFA